ncbi:3882_t:CDS:2, partial [Cetraspora pellucida]
MSLLHNGTKPDGSIHLIIYMDNKGAFYCELNYIESFWTEAKHYERLNCDYTFKSLKQIVLKALDSVGLIKIHHFAHCSACFMSAYELGLSRKATAFA